MEDYIGKISLKNASVWSTTLNANSQIHEQIITKALYPLLWKSTNQLYYRLKSILYECDQYGYKEEDFFQEYPGEPYQKFKDDYLKDGRLWVLRKRYTDIFTELRLNTIIFVTIILEGLINEYLLLKSQSDSKFNRLFGKYSIYKKWNDAPKIFCPDYFIDKKIESLLSTLISQRNSIVHNKPSIEINSIKKSKGELIQQMDVNMTEQVLAFFYLPNKLLENLFSFDKEKDIIGYKMFCLSNYLSDLIRD